ncbi:DNA repair photolyase [uncultured Gammaproteobacteria bacterium]
MIISASYKTDIPAFYGRWLLNRLQVGFCRMVNPYGGQVVTVDLSPTAIDGLVLWTRNLGPFLDGLEVIAQRGLPFFVQYTVTGYPRALETSTIEIDRAADHFHHLRRRFGLRAAVWRYDPIVLTSLTPPDWHLANFTTLAKTLAGTSDEVVVSFLQPYRKTRRNLDAAAHAGNFSWREPEVAEKRHLLAALATIAADHGQRLTLCTQPALTDVPGTTPARCVDAVRLSDVAGRLLPARVTRIKGNRPGCLCVESRDIGAYESCPHGCNYCYAVSSRAVVRQRRLAHDPEGEFLITPDPFHPK